MFQVLGSPVTKAKVDVEDGIRSHLFFKLRSHFLICSYIYICDENWRTTLIMKLAKYRLKAQVEKDEGPSGEGQSPRVEKDECPSGEGCRPRGRDTKTINCC